MPRPDDICVAVELMDTFEKLTVAPSEPKMPSLFSLGFDYDQGDTALPDAVRRVVYEELFSQFCTDRVSGLDLSVGPYECGMKNPSRSADYINTRAKYGLFGLLHTEHTDVFSSKDEPCYFECIEPVSGMTVRTYNDQAAFANYRRGLNRCWSLTYCDHRALQPRMTSILNAVVEAFKVRCISKGDPGVVLLLKWAQEMLHHHLSRDPHFLIRSPPNSKNLRVLGSLREDEKWLSVDYEASTNNLHQIWSKIASYAIQDECGVTNEYSDLWNSSLFGGYVQLCDPKKLNDRRFKRLHGFEHSRFQRLSSDPIKLMKRGQLMGNIMSFPLLCLANAYCLWLTEMVSLGRIIDYHDSRSVVNGDDGVVPVNEFGYGFWQEMSTAMGFPPSVGKVYFDRYFYDFDSECFSQGNTGCTIPLGQCAQEVSDELSLHAEREYYHLHPRRHSQVPFVHIGLCYAKCRTGGDIDLTDLLGYGKGISAGSILRYLVDKAPPSLPLIERLL